MPSIPRVTFAAQDASSNAKGVVGSILLNRDLSSQIRGIGLAVRGARYPDNGLRGRRFANDQRRTCLLSDDGEQMRSEGDAWVTGLLP